MNIHINHFEQLIQQLPPHTDNPVLGVIAEAEPMELQRAANWAIARGVTFEYDEERRRNMEASTAANVSRHGENIRTIYVDHAADMQNLQSQLLNQGLTPDAELMDITFAASETAELPVELLGHAADDTEVLRSIWPVKNDSEVDTIKQNHDFAKEILVQRNRLGRPAKIATWIGSGVVCATVTFGLMQMIGHREESKAEENVALETIVKASAATIVGTSALVPTIHLANRAQRNQARRRARRQI